VSAWIYSIAYGLQGIGSGILKNLKVGVVFTLCMVMQEAGALRILIMPFTRTTIYVLWHVSLFVLMFPGVDPKIGVTIGNIR
jgi:hypothetical protein